MKFLCDQNVYACTVRYLTVRGHDVVVVASLGLSEAHDMDLLLKSRELDRIFVTRDRDFGSLVFNLNIEVGVLYLRMIPSTQESVHEELSRVIDGHPEGELKNAFVVVEPGRHRIRHLQEH